VDIKGGVNGPTWEHSPFLDIWVASTAGFVQYTLVKVSRGMQGLAAG